MAEVVTTRHLVRPEGWRDTVFHSASGFFLEVVRRNPALDENPAEWSVCQLGFDRYGFTAAGKLVGLTGGDRLNRRHAVFSETDALQLARDLVDGKIATRDYETLAAATERFLATAAASEKAAERIESRTQVTEQTVEVAR